MTRRVSAILGKYSPAGQGCTRHFSVPPLEYKNSTSYKKYRPNFGLNIQESYGKRPIVHVLGTLEKSFIFPSLLFRMGLLQSRCVVAQASFLSVW